MTLLSSRAGAPQEQASPTHEPTDEQPSRAPRHLPGEPGIWVFIFGDMTVFALLFGTYLYYRAEDVALFDASQLALNQTYGVINTLLLLTSSLLVVVGVRALRQRANRIGQWMFAGAMACGAGFALMKFLEYDDKISQGLTPATNDFYMYFYILTGLHFVHLLMGMAVLLVLFIKARAPELDRRQLSFVDSGACFWHMVDLLWIVLFPLLYFVR